jgi:hypothetical protein
MTTLKECFDTMQPMGLALALCRALDLSVQVDRDTGEFYLGECEADRFLALVTGPLIVEEPTDKGRGEA